MKQLRFDVFAASVVALILTACSGNSPSGSGASQPAAMPPVHAATIPPDSLFIGWLGASKTGVDVYANATGKWALINTIEQAVNEPESVALSADGFLYVANRFADYVSLYRLSDNGAFSGKLKAIHPTLLAFGPNDTLAVSCEDESKADVVTVFPYGDAKGSYVIREGISNPKALVFDKDGALYVANGNSVITVYDPNGTAPVQKITDGVDEPSSLAIDGANRLYVANPKAYNVTVYAASSRILERTIPVKREWPQAILIDRDHLYIAAYEYTSSLIDYNIATNTSTRITDGLYRPDAIAKCSSTYICAKNPVNVTVYQDDKLVETIKPKNGGPISIASK